MAAACHDASYTGDTELKSFFTSFGTTWQWLSDNGGGMSATDKGSRDKPHQNSIFRSQCIVITPTTRLHVVTVGGKGSAASVSGSSACASGNTSEKGFLGVALQLVATAQWVLSKRRASSSKDPETLTFSCEELAAYVGQMVTVDIVDTFHGRWGWIYARSFLIQGTCQAAALGAEIGRTHKKLEKESQRADAAEAAAEKERSRVATLDAQVLSLSQQLQDAKPARSAAPTADKAVVAALEARIAELEANLKASEAKQEQKAVEPVGQPLAQDELSRRVQDLQAQLASSERSSSSLKEAASRAADQLQEQAAKIRALERRLGSGEGYLVQAAGSFARGVGRLAHCIRPSPKGDPSNPAEREQLQLDQG